MRIAVPNVGFGGELGIVRRGESGKAEMKWETYHRDNEDFWCNDFAILMNYLDVSNDYHIGLHRSLLAVLNNRRCSDESTANEGTSQSRESHDDCCAKCMESG